MAENRKIKRCKTEKRNKQSENIFTAVKRRKPPKIKEDFAFNELNILLEKINAKFEDIYLIKEETHACCRGGKAGKCCKNLNGIAICLSAFCVLKNFEIFKWISENLKFGECVYEVLPCISYIRLSAGSGRKSYLNKDGFYFVSGLREKKYSKNK